MSLYIGPRAYRVRFTDASGDERNQTFGDRRSDAHAAADRFKRIGYTEIVVETLNDRYPAEVVDAVEVK